MKNKFFIVVPAFTLFILTAITSYGQQKLSRNYKTKDSNNSFVADISKKANEDSARLVTIFKDIHANPELGFMETRTAGIVAKELKALGYDVKEGIGKTGVVGLMKNGEGPVVMYRADMDCNSVKETTGLPYASTKIARKADGTETPVMHACGHDAHVTWLIGVAKIMAQMKDKWKGTLEFVCQPAEEIILGAEAMVNDGMYDKNFPKPDYLFAMHTTPRPVGTVGVAKGTRMAGTDQIDVVFKGIGGHGSAPHNSKDPVIMAAEAIMNYQVIVSRVIDPQNAVVLTVGSVQSGSDNNVIPSEALVKVNLRWFDEKDRKLMIDRIKSINEGIAHAYNLPDSLYPVMKMKGWSYPLVNSDTLTGIVVKGIKNIIPENNILKEDSLPRVMGSEDVHHLVIHNARKEYCYIVVGVADPQVYANAIKEGKKAPYSNHSGDYKVELPALPLGVKIGAVTLFEIFRAN